LEYGKSNVIVPARSASFEVALFARPKWMPSHMARRINSCLILVAAGLQPTRGQIPLKTSRGESSRRDAISRNVNPGDRNVVFRRLITTLYRCRWKTQAKDLRLPEKEVFAFARTFIFRNFKKRKQGEPWRNSMP